MMASPFFEFDDPIPVKAEDIHSMIDCHWDMSSSEESLQALFHFSAPQIIRESSVEEENSCADSSQDYNITSQGPGGDTELAPVNPSINGCFSIDVKKDSPIIQGVTPGKYFCVPRDEFLKYVTHVSQQQMFRPPLKRKLDDKTTVGQEERGDGPKIAEVDLGQMSNDVEQSPTTSDPLPTEDSYSPQIKKFKGSQGNEKSEDIMCCSDEMIMQEKFEKHYSVLLRELPDLDPEFLYGLALNFCGDDAKLRAFVVQQTSMAKNADWMFLRLNMLYAEFPNLDRADLLDDLKACNRNDVMFGNLFTSLRMAERELRGI